MGNIGEIFQLRHNVPSKMYTIFMDSLLKTVRNQISFCIVKAYTHLKLKDATRMLHFTNDVETVHFANEKKWVMRDHVFNFDTVESDYPEMKYENVIDKTMAYAHELENI
ncbi:hypothetical protein A3Q56_00608 [Intoshia linei]|uniref:CSN8/PSMD8/EIF3K domain-containing protein n=1 Tax=Intoshia linei TaxID=1819745 RepID=A0A177BDK4_9BILA|nr:hypothetical protein A3Q56_00608 [Intoshia linei]